MATNTFYDNIPAGLNLGNPDLPNWVRPEAAQALPDLNLMEHLLGGTRVMWRESNVYVRKWKDEDDDTYDIRRKGEVVFEGLKRTLNASVGMMFAKPPTMTWNGLEEQGSADAENIDRQGTHIDVFTKRYAEMGLRDGFVVGLVDHPPRPKDAAGAPVETDPDMEKKLALRPSWAIYPRKSVHSWRVETIDFQPVLTQLVLYEPGDKSAGNFGVMPVNRYRVLRVINNMAVWQTWEQVKDVAMSIDAFKTTGSGFFKNRLGEVASRLPVGIGYTGTTTAPLTATLPLLPVAYSNLSHWQLSTNLRFYLDLCCFPQPVVIGALAQEQGITQGGVIGLVPGRIRLGPGVAVHVTSDRNGGNADFKFAELAGSSIQRIEHAINEKLQHMAQLGVAFLTVETRAAETAEAKRIDSVAQNATLSTASRGTEDGINEMWKWHAWYYGVAEEDAPEYGMNRDFENETLDAPTMLAYVTAVEKAGLPIRLLLEAWQQGGRIKPDADLDEIEREMQAAIDAQKELEAQQKQDQIDAMREGAGQDPAKKGDAPPAKDAPPAAKE